MVRKANPTVALFPHTCQVRDLTPKLASRFQRVLVSDVIKVRNEIGGRTFVKLHFQGTLNGDVRVNTAARISSAFKAGSYCTDNLQEGSATVETMNVDIASSIRSKAEAHSVNPRELIVSVDRGIKEKESIHIVKELAKALGAERAGSRAIWLPMERQVGSSGQTVVPKMYLAVGICGAIQHLVGMKGAKTIVAINRDASAPIMEVADIGVVGDLFEIVPALVDEIKKAKSS